MKLKPIKSDYRKDQIGRYTEIGSPVQIRADSRVHESRSDAKNHIINHKIKTNIGSKSKNTIEKLEHVSKYVLRERGVTPQYMLMGVLNLYVFLLL